MEKSGRRRTGGLVVMAIFVVIMVLFSGLCWWLWHNREQEIPTRVLGYELMPMEGDSMEPELADGSVLLLNDAVLSELRSGDAIVYDRANGQGGTVVRIVNLAMENNETTLLVKSDRDLESTELSPEKVNSRVVGSIPLLGTFWNFIMTGRGLLTAIVAPCALFFLIEMAYLIYYARSGASERRRSEAGDLKRKAANHHADDQQENFVDVTARFTGDGRNRSYQSPLRKEMDRISDGPDEDVAPESLTDKYADLDFNPLVREEESSGLERVVIPDAPAAPVLTVAIDGEEAARLSLSEPREISVKTGGFRIDITVAPDR